MLSVPSSNFVWNGFVQQVKTRDRAGAAGSEKDGISKRTEVLPQ